MKKKIITITIVSMFLILCFSTTTVTSKTTQDPSTNSAKGVYVKPWYITVDGNGAGIKSFTRSAANGFYIMILNLTSCERERSYLYPLVGKDLVYFYSGIIIIIIGRAKYSPSITREAKTNWWGFLSTRSLTGDFEIHVDVDSPWLVIIR
jgi:hypothetical protein